MGDGTTELTRPVPLYMQVVQQLRAQIASGEIAEGDVLPSQRQMMQRWKISMQTASKVIGALKTEGIAEPSIGRDTIVATGAAARIAAAARGTAHAPASESAPAVSAAVLSVKAAKVAVPAHVGEVLGIPSGRRALRRTEVRGSADQALEFAASWYPATIADAAPQLAVSEPLPGGSLAYIAETTGTRLRRANEQYVAESSNEEAAEALSIPSASAVLVVRTRLYDAEGNLIEYAETTLPAGVSRDRTFTITGN